MIFRGSLSFTESRGFDENVSELTKIRVLDKNVSELTKIRVLDKNLVHFLITSCLAHGSSRQRALF